MFLSGGYTFNSKAIQSGTDSRYIGQQGNVRSDSIIEMKTASNKNSISTSGEDKTNEIQRIVHHQPCKAHEDILGCQRKKTPKRHRRGYRTGHW